MSGLHDAVGGASSRPQRTVARVLSALVLLSSLLGMALQPQLARAAGITVTTTLDEDNGSLGGGSGVSLREAVRYAKTGDVITLPSGTYNLTIPGKDENLSKTGDLDVVGKSITLTGAGASTTKIVANFPQDAATMRDRVFDILSSAALTISGVSLSGGISDLSGGGIYNRGTLAATNIIVRGNFAVVVNEDVIGGVNGGGITNIGGATATITASEISGNTANRSGGGIYNMLDATMTLNRTTVANNVTVRENGGGINNEGTLTIVNSTISGNSSNRSGGGLYNNGSATILNTTITGNICNADTRLGGNGGGVFNNSPTPGSLVLKNSLIAGNQDLATPDVPQTVFPDLSSEVDNTISGNSNNLIGSRNGIANSTTVGTPGQSDIINPNIALSALADNGGTGQTHRPLPTSPAVDAANNATCAAAPVSNVDQRGRSRPTDGNADGTAICEIGAIEIRAAVIVSSGATVLANNGALSFGSTQRDTPLTRTLTISNTGDANLALNQGSINLPNGYSLVDGFGSAVIAPGDSTTLAIRLNATALGNVNGPLTFNTNDPSVPVYTLNLSSTVTPKAAAIALADDSDPLENNALITFGSTGVGIPVTKQLTIKNNGDSNLTISTITLPTGFSISSPPGVTTLPGGASTVFTVQLDAAAAGAFAGKLSIASNASNQNPFELRLEGSVSGSTSDQLSVLDLENIEPLANNGTIAFGSTIVGTPLERTFAISNIGNANLTITAPITVPNGFSVVGTFSTITLTPGQGVDLTLRADATSVGTFTGVVTFANTDSDENPFSFNVSATVGAQPAKITVTDGITPISDNTSKINFGSTIIRTPVVKTFTVRNTGGIPLTLGTVSLPAGFSLVSPLAASLAPNTSTTFQVRLNATAVGSYGGNISFSTSDTTANPFNFSIVGIVNNPPPNVEVKLDTTTVVSGTTVTIGTTPLGTPIRKTFTIKNTGGSTLRIDSISVPPGFIRDPSVITADTLLPDKSTTFVIVLEASAVGSYDGQVTVRTSDPDQSRFSFIAKGTVTQAKVYLPLIRR